MPDNSRMEYVEVPAHTTQRLTVEDDGGEWVFTSIRTGCIRVQRGTFCEYITLNGAIALRDLLNAHIDKMFLSEVDYPPMKVSEPEYEPEYDDVDPDALAAVIESNRRTQASLPPLEEPENT